MTVTYTAEVASCQKFGCFIKLLARWRGSIYKIIWMDLVLFLTLYYGINCIYFYLLEEEAKETFETIVYYCASYASLIPLSFVLGFYVHLVMSRWWEQYTTIPWPDSIAVFVSAYVHGLDEGGRLMRRTIMRYVCLCLTIVFTMISPCVKKRFPKLKHLVDAGLLLENEKQIFEAMDCAFPKYPKHWMPIIWAASIISRARKEGRIRDDYAVKTMIDELNSFRGRCGILMYYDFISIPLVYTQVVTIAVYSFFVCSLLGHQWTEKKKDTYQALDFYAPVFITLQFFFYMGWLKVAETLINPFGEDDDDFEVNWMVDRNLQVSYLIVDEMHHEHPELVRDQYWDEVYPSELPYESEAKREQPPEYSTAKYGLEDSMKYTPSRIPSHATSFIVNGKIPSLISRRSQQFNEAFQRFLNFSENDATTLRPDVENSLLSIADIENIEHITSYTYFDKADVDFQPDTDNIKETSTLEPIVEEGEEALEPTDEEEMPNIEEEEDNIEMQSSYESDSDSDLFERLCIERQQQRLQRMNDYLERHFGSNFRIITKFSAPKGERFKNKAEDITFYNKPSSGGENNEEKEIPTVSTDCIKTDVGSVSSSAAASTCIQSLLPEESKKSTSNDVGNTSAVVNQNSYSSLQNEFNLRAQTEVSFEKQPEQRTSVLLEPLEVETRTSITHDVASNENSLELQSQFSTTQIISSVSSKQVKPTLDSQPSVSLNKKPHITFKTQATSPMSSSSSVSSSEDDWEILTTGNSSITGQYEDKKNKE